MSVCVGVCWWVGGWSRRETALFSYRHWSSQLHSSNFLSWRHIRRPKCAEKLSNLRFMRLLTCLDIDVRVWPCVDRAAFVGGPGERGAASLYPPGPHTEIIASRKNTSSTVIQWEQARYRLRPLGGALSAPPYWEGIREGCQRGEGTYINVYLDVLMSFSAR